MGGAWVCMKAACLATDTESPARMSSRPPNERNLMHILFSQACISLNRLFAGTTGSVPAAIFTRVSPSLTVAVDGRLRVDWSVASSLSDLALLGSTRTSLARRLILTAPLAALDFSEVYIPNFSWRHLSSWSDFIGILIPTNTSLLRSSRVHH